MPGHCRSPLAGLLSATAVAFLSSEFQVAFATRVALNSDLYLGSGLLRTGAGVGVNGRYRLAQRLRLWSLDLGQELPVHLQGLEGAAFLAKGSFGEAWRARDSESGKDVIVKMFFRKDRPKYLPVKYISSSTATSAEAKGLAAEEWACKQVRNILQMAVQDGHRHPGAEHICNCIEENMDFQHAYVVQDFCGEALSDWQPTNNQSRLRAAAAMAYQMFSVLDLLGNADYPRIYIHHDLKLANVAVAWSADGVPSVRIIDWGAMRLIGAEPSLADCVWNRKYAPPELRFKQEPPCVQNDLEYTYDVFAVGAMLGVLLTGSAPAYSNGEVDFDWDTMQQSCAHEVPTAAADLVRRLTSTEPARRPVPAAAVLSPALAVHALHWLLGSWQHGDTVRGYYISAPQAGAVAFPLQLAVLTAGETRGVATIDKGVCDFLLLGGNNSCCAVPVNYLSRKYRKFLYRRPHNITIMVELCPLSFWTLRFVERPVSSDTPRHFLHKALPFRRAANSASF
mmetsp:Transcript_62115/g.156805  ORF Transcript_62115/g.156805 Transcript_62115/m.156805 type:complete len:509 (-) Transcript_62115:63-1589(-)